VAWHAVGGGVRGRSLVDARVFDAVRLKRKRTSGALKQDLVDESLLMHHSALSSKRCIAHTAAVFNSRRKKDAGAQATTIQHSKHQTAIPTRTLPLRPQHHKSTPPRYATLLAVVANLKSLIRSHVD